MKWASEKLENKPQSFKVVALFAFEAASDNELAFDEGDVITVHGILFFLSLHYLSLGFFVVVF
jgi:hypothetical protein